MKIEDGHNKKRLFFALWPDAEVLQEITVAAQQLQDYRGRTIAAENLHMTLVFIGNADSNRQSCLEMAAEKIKAKPFEIILDTFGYFRKPKILWLGAKLCPPALQKLVDDLTIAFADCAYQPEHPHYIPHVSLTRKAEFLKDDFQGAPIHWAVDRFYLAESVSVEGGVIYQKLKTYMMSA